MVDGLLKVPRGLPTGLFQSSICNRQFRPMRPPWSVLVRGGLPR